MKLMETGMYRIMQNENGVFRVQQYVSMMWIFRGDRYDTLDAARNAVIFFTADDAQRTREDTWSFIE